MSNRAQRRRASRRVQQQTGAPPPQQLTGEQLAALAMATDSQLHGGELRILPCSVAEHPFHVQKWCDNHKQWEPMDDDAPLAAAMIAVVSQQLNEDGTAGEVTAEEVEAQRCQGCFNLQDYCTCEVEG